MNNVSTADIKSLIVILAETANVYLLDEELAHKAEGRCLLPKVDIRNVDDPSKLAREAVPWYDKGTNHRLIGNRIARDLESNTWEYYAVIPDLKTFLVECDPDDLSYMCTVVQFGELTVFKIAPIPDWNNW